MEINKSIKKEEMFLTYITSEIDELQKHILVINFFIIFYMFYVNK